MNYKLTTAWAWIVAAFIYMIIIWTLLAYFGEIILWIRELTNG